MKKICITIFALLTAISCAKETNTEKSTQLDIARGVNDKDNLYKNIVKIDIGQNESCSGVIIDKYTVITTAHCFITNDLLDKLSNINLKNPNIPYYTLSTNELSELSINLYDRDSSAAKTANYTYKPVYAKFYATYFQDAVLLGYDFAILRVLGEKDNSGVYKGMNSAFISNIKIADTNIDIDNIFFRIGYFSCWLWG